MQKNVEFDAATQKNLEQWLSGHYDSETKAQIQKLLIENPKEIIDAFYTKLNFGTGGLRGVMGVGTNRMNVYTVRAATQGLANYINQQFPHEEKSAVVGYDSRINSKKFAEETAKVLAANGIHVFLFKDIRPVALISYACRYKKSKAAVMITASHNPPEYNGYKVYWDDGAQVLPPHDQGIIQEVNKITDVTQVKTLESLNPEKITYIGEEINEAYLKDNFPLQNYPEQNKQDGDKLKIVYTSLHGTGITIIPKALRDWGFSNLILVEEQIIPDGRFPTVKSPNPEEKTALSLGIEKLIKTQADLLIATDPDTDRIGVAINHDKKVVLLNGNQVAAILLEHICNALTNQNRMPKRAAFVKTIGTTELFKAITDHYHSHCENVLTGFKYIAEKIRQWENEQHGYQFVFGGEESYGYLLGTHVRDKDGVLSALLICEAALQAKLQNKTLLDFLDDLFKKYGVYYEKLISFTFPETKEGKEKMNKAMVRLRETPLESLCGIPIVEVEDYLNSKKIHLKTGKKENLTLPQSNVLLYWLEDGTKLMVRPSGTEPKLKIYCGVVEANFQNIEEGMQNAQQKADNMLNQLVEILQK